MRCAPALPRVSSVQLAPSSERPAATQSLLPSSGATKPSSETDIFRTNEACAAPFPGWLTGRSSCPRVTLLTRGLPGRPPACRSTPEATDARPRRRRVRTGVQRSARGTARQGEGAHPRARRAGRRTPALRDYRTRMGWADWPWYTTLDDFSADFDVDQWFGINVFLRDGDDMYRSYYTTSRAAEDLSSVWGLLDIMPF